MARYTSEDQRNLEEIIEEGRLDRLFARGAQALGAIKGAGQQLKGKAQQAYGGALNKAAELGGQALGVDASQGTLAQKGQGLQAQGQGNVQTGAARGQNAKIDYMKKNITKRIDKFVADLNDDVQKLGLNIGEIKFASEIENALEGLKQNLQTNQATPPPLPRQSQATPPPLPQDATVDDQVEPEEDDGASSYAAQRQQRSERSKQAAARRKQQQSKAAPNLKKSKPRNIQQTYDKNFVREDYEKLFWGE